MANAGRRSTPRLEKASIKRDHAHSVFVEVANRATPSMRHRDASLDQRETLSGLSMKIERFGTGLDWATVARCSTDFCDGQNARRSHQYLVGAFAGVRIGKASSIKTHRRSVGLAIARQAGGAVVACFETDGRRVR